MNKLKPEPNIDDLTRLYLIEGKNMKQISQILNMSTTKISNTLKKHNIKKTPEQIINDRKKYLISTLGVSCSLHTQESQEKIKATSIKKRGVEHVSKDPKVKEKKKKTYQEHYGVDHYSKTQEYADKCKATLMEHLGVEYPMQSEEVRKKKNKTMMEKYGVKSAVEVRWIRYREQKAKEANEN